MSETPRLDLPYLAASQAQKEVYHNLSLDRLDLLVQCAVLDRNLAAPPATPALGDAYIIATGATGVWAGHDHALALYVSSQWEFIAPLPGFQCWVLDEAVQVGWSGTAWTIITGGGGGATTLLALTDTPDSYTGQAGKALLVNAGETAVEFGTVTGGSGAPLDASYLVGASHASLTAERVVTDSPNITWDLSTAGQVKATVPAGSLLLSQIESVPTQRLLGRGAPGDGDLHTISLGTGLTLSGSTLSAAGGSSDFLGLSDTPDSYSGQAGKVVQVNAGATALEFGTASGGLDTEAVQDVVGAMLTDSATLDFSYDDTAGTATGSVKDASLTEAKLSLSDVTTQNVSTTQHGFTPKAPGSATQFLNGTGAWSTPAGGSSYTDEQAQDAVGGILSNTSAIIFTYSDATPSISAALGFGGVASDRIADDAITFAKMQNITDARLLGRSTGAGPGNVGEITVGTGLSLSGGTLTASASGTPLSVARYAASGTALESAPLTVDASGNLRVGTVTPGTSAQRALVVASGVRPTAAHPADAVQLWVEDQHGIAGMAGLKLRSEDSTITTLGPGLLHRKSVLTLTASGVGAPYAPSTENSGLVIVGSNSTEITYIQLPAASDGLHYVVINFWPSPLGTRVVATAGTTIRIVGLVSTAGGYCQSQVVGSFLTLIATSTTAWTAINVSAVADWTVG